MADTCTHLDQIHDVTPTGDGCQDWWCFVDELAFEVPDAPVQEHR